MRQVSNAYRLAMPPRAARLLGVQGEGVPLPDDVAQAHQDRRQDVQAIKAGLGLEDLAATVVDDGPLARALAGLGRLVQERESAGWSETQAKTSY